MIVELKEIPVNAREKNRTQRSMIRKDLEYIFENKIRYSEIKGEYNFRNLGAYFREEARIYFYEMLKCDTEVASLTYLQRSELRINYKRISDAAKEIFKISQRKAEDGIHVYVECNAELFSVKVTELVDVAIKQAALVEQRRAERIIK